MDREAPRYRRFCSRPAASIHRLGTLRRRSDQCSIGRRRFAGPQGPRASPAGPVGLGEARPRANWMALQSWFPRWPRKPCQSRLPQRGPGASHHRCDAARLPALCALPGLRLVWAWLAMQERGAAAQIRDRWRSSDLQILEVLKALAGLLVALALRAKAPPSRRALSGVSSHMQCKIPR